MSQPAEGDTEGLQRRDDREEKEFDDLFDDDASSEGDRQDEVDSLFDDERESEDATQKEVDDLFKEDD